MDTSASTTTSGSQSLRPRQPIEADGLNPYRWIILVGLITAAILEVLDTTIVNVALPQMAGNLGATSQEIGWVSTGYILSNVIVLPMTAWLSSRFGRKNYLTGSILLFILASFFCGISGSLIQLVFWRIVQGAGGAALLSTAQSTLREIFPPQQQGTVQAIYILGIISAPTLGPSLGGWITDNYSWQWVFFINIPIGLFSAALVFLFLDDAAHKMSTIRIDWAGIFLLATGLGTLQYVLEEGNKDDWFDSALITRLTIISVLSLITLVWWELSPRNRGPVVNFRVLKNRELSAALFLLVALGFGLYGGIFLFPIFAQNILHFTPTQTGLVLLPGGIATGIAAMLCGRILNGQKRLIHPRFLIGFGLVMFTISMYVLGHMTTSSGFDDTKMALILRGAGLGFLFIPINLAGFSTLKGAEIAQGSAMMNLMRQLGGSFGIAVLGTYLTNHTTYHINNISSHINAGNIMFDQRIHGITAALIGKGYSPYAAKLTAYKVLGLTIKGQATTMAFDDSFLLIGLAMVIVSPAIFLMRSGKPSGGAPADMH